MSVPARSRENAVATALEILDAEGAGALTMRRVARDIGVPLMSLYRHVRSRGDLEAAVVAELIRGVRPARRTGAWDADLRAWAVAYRAMVVAHPNAASLLASQPAIAYAARPDDVEAMLRALGDAGLDPVGARVQLRTALVVITGFCHAQQAARGSLASVSAPDGPTAVGHPLLAELIADVRAGRHADDLFASMLDGVVAGIEHAMARRRSS